MGLIIVELKMNVNVVITVDRAKNITSDPRLSPDCEAENAPAYLRDLAGLCLAP
jgi:hypothetical protein